MELVRLIYVSKMTEECDIEAIQNVLRASHQNNPKNEISGILCYDSVYFLQCLEGPKQAVNSLYARIIADPRHMKVTILNYTSILRRTFGKWAMAFLKTSDLDKDTLKEYMNDTKFSPYKLEGDQAMNFLVTIIAQEKERLKV